MSKRTMTLEEFGALVDAWGGHPDRWPDESRDGAEALVQASSDARALQAEATALDDMLAATADVPVSDDFVQSLMTIPTTKKQDRARKSRSGGRSLSFRFLFPRFAGLAASAALIGFVMGTSNLIPVESVFETASAEVETVDLSDFMFPDTDDEVDT